MSLHIVLYQPEIPPNTGNLIRLCANAGMQLHLIGPLGFDVNDKQCRRAGLDYHAMACVQEYQNYAEFCEAYPLARIFACSTKAELNYDRPHYRDEDMFLFGPETRGLPATILQQTPRDLKIRIPMLEGSRSINLANAASIIVFEAWRQLEFVDLFAGDK